MTAKTPGRRAARGAAGLPTRMWTAQETADFLGISIGRLYQLNHEATGPRFSKLGPKGRSCRYNPHDVQLWLEEYSSDAGAGPVAV